MLYWRDFPVQNFRRIRFFFKEATPVRNSQPSQNLISGPKHPSKLLARPIFKRSEISTYHLIPRSINIGTEVIPCCAEFKMPAVARNTIYIYLSHALTPHLALLWPRPTVPELTTTDLSPATVKMFHRLLCCLASRSIASPTPTTTAPYQLLRSRPRRSLLGHSVAHKTVTGSLDLIPRPPPPPHRRDDLQHQLASPHP